MDPVHIETYKGFEIRIYAWREASNGGYVGMYEISWLARRDTVKGGFVIAHDAERAALEKAKSWIDQR